MRTVDIDTINFPVPSYDGESIVNLMASISLASGNRPQYAQLQGLDLHKLTNAQHIVLLVIDGLGFQFLQSCPSGHVMRRYCHGSMSSVFPPTTATAITTYLTGLAPRQHGLTGWFMYLKELEEVITVLPFTTRLGSVALTDRGLNARSLFGHVPVFDCMDRTTFSVAPLRIAHSEFNQAHAGIAQIKAYESLTEFYSTIEDVVTQTTGRSYTYAYWPELDYLSHVNGVSSPSVEKHLAELDAGLDDLLHRLRGTDTVIVATADHGFVDIPSDQIVTVADHPQLSDALRSPLCGEPRSAYCYVSPDRRQGFLDYVASELAEYAICVRSETLIEQGYFGPGISHPQLKNRVGDFTLLMRDGYAIQDKLPAEERANLIGMHGGSSTAEMLVPLIVAEA